jgi:hypothetical protein
LLPLYLVVADGLLERSSHRARGGDKPGPEDDVARTRQLRDHRRRGGEPRLELAGRVVEGRTPLSARA